MDHTIERGRGDWIVVRTRGLAAVEGFSAFLSDVVTHPDWRSGMDLLLDHRDLDGSALSEEDIHQLTDEAVAIDGELGGGRWAVVLANDLGFGLARMWQSVPEGKGIPRRRLFRVVEEAEAWLAAPLTADQ